MFVLLVVKPVPPNALVAFEHSLVSERRTFDQCSVSLVREARLDPGPPLRAVERRDLAIDPVPVDRTSELRQLVFEVDDLVKLRSYDRKLYVRSPSHLACRPSASLTIIDLSVQQFELVINLHPARALTRCLSLCRLKSRCKSPPLALPARSSLTRALCSCHHECEALIVFGEYDDNFHSRRRD
jgi:hypothetical protein